MNLLSIETSCDETAIAVINFNELEKNNNQNHFNLLSNNILSQINIHREFGGVYPAVAKREHAKNITSIFEKSLKESGIYFKKDTEKIFNDLEIKKLVEIKNLLEREGEMYLELEKLFLKIEKPDIKAVAVTSGPGLAPAL